MHFSKHQTTAPKIQAEMMPSCHISVTTNKFMRSHNRLESHGNIPERLMLVDDQQKNHKRRTAVGMEAIAAVGQKATYGPLDFISCWPHGPHCPANDPKAWEMPLIVIDLWRSFPFAWSLAINHLTVPLGLPKLCSPDFAPYRCPKRWSLTDRSWGQRSLEMGRAAYLT